MSPLPSSTMHSWNSSMTDNIKGITETFIPSSDVEIPLPPNNPTPSTYTYLQSVVTIVETEVNALSVVKRTNDLKDADDGARKKQPLLCSLGETITLLVGKSGIVFSIHKDVLCGSSKWFEEVSQSASDRKIRLPDEDPLVIQIACYWMYHNQICVPKEIARRPYYHQYPLETTQGLLVKLFLAGEKYKIQDLKNDAIDGIILESHAVSLVHMSDYIYGRTCKNSQIRDLLVALVAHRFLPEDLIQDRNYIGREFMFDLVLSAFIGRESSKRSSLDKKRSPKENFCKFHEHEKDSKPCVCLKEFVVEEDLV